MNNFVFFCLKKYFLHTKKKGRELYKFNSFVPPALTLMKIKALLLVFLWMIMPSGLIAQCTSIPTPGSVSCSGSNTVSWNQSIQGTNLCGPNGLVRNFEVRLNSPNADMGCGNGVLSSTYTPPLTGNTSLLNSPVTATISWRSWDGYCTRASSDPQPNERWRLAFYKNGSLVTSTNYTADLGEGQTITRSGTFNSVTLPNGADQVRIQHINHGTGSTEFASVYPVGFCISMTPLCPVETTITQHPSNQSICQGETTSLSGGATGTNLSYRWQYESSPGNWANTQNNTPSGITYSGETSTTLSITTTNGVSTGSYRYRLRVTSGNPNCDNANSNAATLTVSTCCTPPSASTPSDAGICAGSSHTFTSTVSGTAPISYQWRFWNGSSYVNVTNGTPAGVTYSGGTTNSLTITTSSSTPAAGYGYQLTATNACGSAATNHITLTVQTCTTCSLDAGSNLSTCAAPFSTVTLSGASISGYTTTTWSTISNGQYVSLANSGSLNGATLTPTAAMFTQFNNNGYTPITVSVQLTGTGGGCTTATDTRDVTFYPFVYIDAGPDLSTCEGVAVVLNGQFVGSAGTTSSWSASPNVGTFGNVSSPITSYTPPSNYTGIITLTLTSSDPAGPCTAASDGLVLNVTASPTVEAGPDQATCEDSSITLTGSIGGSASSGTWTASPNVGVFSNANQVSGSTYTPPSSFNGAIQLTLMTNDPAGSCIAVSDFMTLTVNQRPVLNNPPIDATVCSGQSHVFTVDSPASGVVYTWFYRTTPPPANCEITTLDGWTFLQNGGNTLNTGARLQTTYYLLIAATSSTCFTTYCATVTIGTPPLFITQPSGAMICQGGSTTLSATVSGSDITYQWEYWNGVSYVNVTDDIPVGVTYSGGNNSNLTITTSSATLPVDYGWRLMATNACGSEYSDHTTVNVTNVNVITGPDVAICAGSNVTIQASASNGTAPYTYVWNNNLGAGASHVVAPSTTTTYRVTVTDDRGCIGIDSILVTVNPNPDVFTMKIDATCGQNNGSATASATSGTAPYTFMWSSGLGTGATKNNLAPGTYGVTVLDANDCFDIGSVVINNIGGPSIDAGDDDEICLGESVTLTASTSGGTAPVSITWMPGNLSGASITVSPASTTTYTATATDANGCVASDEVVVTVNPNPSVTAMGTDPDCDQNNGTATATPSGGTAPYTYAWSNGGTTAMITGLAPGIYTVTVTDSKGCTGPNSTATVTINEVLCASLGDFVWEDLDGDGIFDAGEPPVEGVTVNLKDADGNIIDNTSTNGVGFYQFTNLEPGDYSVQFVLPAGYQFTTANQGGNEALDSDANPAMNGMTEVVTLMSGDNYPNLDAGLTTYDLALTKDINGGTPGPYAPNSPVDFNITVTNEGSQAAANVVVTDRVPAGLTITGFDVNGTSVINNGNGTYTIPALAIDQSVTFIVKTTIDNNFQGTSLVNVAEITVDNGDDTDSTPNNDVPEEDDQDDETINIEQTYDLALTKDLLSAGPFAQGDDVTFTITVTNEGSLNAANVEVTDRPETGFTFAGANVPAGVTNNGDGTFVIASLLQGASVSFEVTYTISATFQGTSLNNEAEITEDDGDDEDSTPDNDVPTEDDQDDETINIEQTYDLALTKDLLSAGPFAQGDDVTFTITVTNEGSLNAANVEVTDRPETGFTFAGANVPAGVTNNGDGTFVIASLLQGASVSFEVTYTIDATFQGTSLNNEAEITEDDGDDEDSTPDNDVPTEDDQDDETINIEQTYDLALTKDLLSAGPFTQGDDVTFTITITNEGSLNAANVEVTDRPETGFTFAGANVPAGVTNNGDGTFVIASLLQGASVSFEVTYTIDATFQGTSLNNEAEITEDDGDDEDSTPDNDVPTEDDQDDETINIDQTYDLALTKDLLSAGPFTQGDDVTFTITVTNEGSLNAANVEVTDRPEAGFTFAGANVPAGVTNNGDGTFVIASLLQGASVSFEVTYTIDATFQGTSLNNEAEITEDDGDDEDSTPDNDVPTEDDQDDEVVPVSQTASVDIEKATNGQDADNAPGVFIIVPNVAPTVTWTYVVTNTGTLDLTNVEVVDDQEGLVGVIPFLAAGASETLTLTGTAMRGRYRNNATVTAQPVDVNGNPTGDEVDDTDPSNYTGVFINIDKEGDREEICAGEEVNFSLTMRILGGTEGIQLRNMSVEDSNLPEDLLPYDQYFDANSDPEGNSYIDFIDNNNDGISDQEFVWNYALTYLQTTTNMAQDMAEIWYVDPITGDEFFIGTASNNDQWTVTVNQNLCASLGDFVWEDYDADGIQDDGEPGVEGVTVNLKDEDGNIIDTQETGPNGEYLFAELTPGTYSVAFVLPTGFTFTNLNEGGNEALDSDADPAMNGMTETVTLDYGDNYEDLDAGIVRDPELDMVKDLVSVTSLGDEQFVVTYQVTVTNTGGATTYDLNDVPGFDDDITITSASYTTTAAGNAGGALAGSGPWSLADDQFITTFGTDVYTITVNVSRDLSANSTDGGDNEYTPCGVVGNGPGSAPGQGLYNLAQLDTNNDGNPDIEDDACGDLPNIDMVKDFVSATPNGDGTYTVLYNVIVTNTGGAEGEYDLQDTPGFDDDITINSGSFTGQNSGTLSAGANTLATDEAIAAGGTHTYNLSFNVTLDLSGDADDNDGGDNVYTACSEAGNGPGSNPGEGLYNLAQLDVDGDGDFDVEDDACGDLPNITLVKELVSTTIQPDGSYRVVYTITMVNNGGADGQYTLTDSPLFENDVTITAWDYTFIDVNGGIGNGPAFQGAPPVPINFGTKTLTAGNTHIYTLGFNVVLDLTGTLNDGGDDVYNACGTGGPNGNGTPGNGLYNLAQADIDGDGDVDLEDDACGDLPNLTMVKDFGAATPNGDGTYTVTYTVTVANNGGAEGTYTLLDTPGFDDDVTINSGSYTGQNSGGLMDGENTLATNEAIAAGATHVYNLSFNVSLDLSANSTDGGDNQYTACSEAGNGPGSNPGEGLYNLAQLDINNDGTPDLEDDACGDLPNLTMTKTFGSTTINPNGSYTVTYTVTVANNGGAEGSYTLLDTPSFDDDITINSGSFSGQNSGGLIDGENTLATNEAIAAGDVHVYNLSFNVTLDLSGDANDNDGGDNVYTACGESSDNGGINPGEGLYNLAQLDIDNDGDADIEDEACGDLPNITLDKGLLGVTDNGDGTFGVSYQIVVTNNGGAAGTYGLVDVPAFDDDVIILGGGFLIQQGGPAIAGSFTGDPTPLTLATNQSIAAGATHTYTIDFLAELDLSPGSTDGGDNEYTACADPSGGNGSEPGQGLYNRAELDLNNDGTPDLVDDVCGDVPTADLSLIKTVNNETPDVGDVVTFTITVTNEGPQNATNVAVEDVVPNGYSNISNITSGGTVAGNIITWTGINLAVGQQQSVSFNATVQAPGADVDYVNIAEITAADQYDSDSTPNNGADTNEGNGIGSEDPDGTQDPNDEDDGDDAGVMPPCMLTVEFAPTSCQDNGTPTNPNDDFFEIIAQVTGMNASGSWTATDSRGNNYTGAYGVDFVFGPYSISGSEGDQIIITITDSEDGACSTFISATTPEETCSNDCIITVTEPQTVECIGGETNTPDDDAFIFTINVNGVNVGDQGWRAEDQYSNVYFGNYGFSPNTFVDFGPYSFVQYGGTSIILTVTDVENPDCGQGTLVLNVPNESCSQDCSINLDVEYVVCDDNGTEWDPSDDVFYAWVNITGDNASFQGWITDDEGRADGDNTGYYGLHEFGPYPISAGNHSLTIMDRVTEDCEATIMLEAPGTCSDGCLLTATQQAPVCDNLGTADPSDDVYYVTVSVQPLGNFSNTGWRISLGNGNFLPGGAYGAQVVLGPYLISEGPRTINIVDNTYISCRTTIQVIPPTECSDPDPCSMVVGTFQQGPCNDNGTGDTTADDFYTLTYSAPNVSNPVGTQYQLLLDGAVVATNSYGTGGTISVPSDGQIHMLTWRDATDATCAASATLPAVGPCSDTPCAITTVFNFIYDDNGTPLDHTDDTYTLLLMVMNNGSSSGFWTISNLSGMNQTYPYGQQVFISGIDANSDFAATIADSQDPTCSVLIRNNGQAVVGNFVWVDADCDGIQDNGELGLAGVIVTIIGTDMNGNPVTATTVTDENGAYLFTNLPAGFDYKVTFSEPAGYDYAPANQGGNDGIDSDAGNNGMTTTFMLMSSSVDLTIDAGFCAEPEPCNIQPGTITLGTCVVNENISQYAVTFTSPVITNGCGQYQILLDGVLFYTGTTGDAGSTIMVPADNASHTITFRDACAANCARSVGLAPVAPCFVECTIEPGTITNVTACNDNGTPDNSTDDFYSLSFTAPSTQEGCANYQVLLDGTLVYTGTYGDAGSTITVPADGASHGLVFRDACLADCATGVVLDPVDPCSTPVCAINAQLLSGPTCTDNGDEFTVTFQLTGTNNGVGWFATDNQGGVFNGFYNTPVTRTYTAAAGTVITINFRDLENSDCVTTLTFTAPDCGGEPCAIACVAAPSVCNDNGTPLDGTDDTFTAVITTDGIGVGGCFTYVIGGQTFTGTYGVPFTVGPFPISGGNVIFEVTDCDNSDCSHLMLVLAPEPCSDGNLTVECPTSNHFCPILGEDIMLYRTDPFECTSTVVVTPPVVSGACGDGDITFTVALVNQFGTVLQTIAAGEPLVFENVSLGDYILRYTVMDDCGVTGTRDCTIRVADIDEPIAICNGVLNVQLGGWGLARLYTQSVDAGSYDNCAIASIELRRVIARDQETCEDLDEPTYSAWGPYVQFTCCDASTYVTVEMRVTDVNGNYNICWLDVLVEDKTLPYCTGLTDVLAECDDLPANFDPSNTAQLSTLFGEPEVIDNCSAAAEEQVPVLDLDANGNGTITRRFLAIDAAGNVSSTEFQQVITIVGCQNVDPNGGGVGSTGQVEFNDAVMEDLPQLLQNYPNPANTQTVIPFYLPALGNATIEVFDARGSRVFNLKDNFLEGRNEVRIDVSRLSDGLYFYKLTYGDHQLTSKMMVTKN